MENNKKTNTLIIGASSKLSKQYIEKYGVHKSNFFGVSSKVQGDIKDSNITCVVVAAYGQIIPEKILNIPNIIFLNIHASLLPKWRGAAPIQRSIIKMDKITGISIMKIIPKLDAGPYLLQESIKIENHDNFTLLSKKLSFYSLI